MAYGHLVTVDEITAEDISPCDECGRKFEMGEDFFLDERDAETTGVRRCICLDCMEAM
jgi:hypothetical protein